MPERRTLVFLGLMSLSMLGGWVITASPLFVFSPGAHRHGLDPLRILAFTGATALAVAWALWFATVAHHRLDEFQVERAKTVAYWGTSLGVAVSGPIFVFVSFGGLHWIDTRAPIGRDLALAFDYGYGLAIVSVGLGCLAVGAWRRLVRR